MDKLERAFHVHKIFTERRTPVPITSLCERLECSESTVKRTFRDMRLYLDAPIINVSGLGYCYAKNSTFELPGIWFSADELYGLLTIHRLAASLSGSFFDASIQSIRNKVEVLVGANIETKKDVMERIRILATGSRGRKLPLFPLIADAVLSSKRIRIRYDGRQRGEQTEREVSPQRWVYYRGNWYLDAWCHKANALRTFAAERIVEVSTSGKVYKSVSKNTLDKAFTRSFGIFGGAPVATVVLRFTSQAARWVADEEWFPGMEDVWLDDGRYELRIPYNNPTELIMEICRYGADVEVVEPPDLRQQVAERLKQAAGQYQGKVTI